MKKVEIDKSIIEKYINSGKLKKQICSELGISIGTLRRVVRDLGLTFPVRSWRKGGTFIKDYLFIDKQWLEDNWVNEDKSLAQLSTELNIPYGVLENRRRKFALSKKYKYTVDTSRLFDVTNPNTCYLAGLTATDGYVPKGRNTIEIRLVGDSELALLIEIKDYFQCTAPVQHYGNSHSLRITSDGLNTFFLRNFNIPDGAKTFSVGVPTGFASELCAKAYIHGCIDGDGWVAKDGSRVTLTTASENLVSGLCSIITRYTGIDVKFRYVSYNKHTYPSFALDCKKGRDFLHWLYTDCDYIFLKRKIPQVDDIV